ncbi:MAG TPA: hypothetical protein VMR90_08705 [Candidatus Cybelea sp.]|nr:hypothetical protein [Candidatus Cybelea sp.]
MERGKSKGFANSIGDLTDATVAVVEGEGSTNAIEVTSERSESWQQDIAHAIIPNRPCPQSI